MGLLFPHVNGRFNTMAKHIPEKCFENPKNKKNNATEAANPGIGMNLVRTEHTQNEEIF